MLRACHSARRFNYGDLRVLGELRRRGNVHAEPHDVAHAIQRSQLFFRERKRVRCGCVRRFSARVHIKVFADDANDRRRVARSTASAASAAALNGHRRADYGRRNSQSTSGVFQYVTRPTSVQPHFA